MPLNDTINKRILIAAGGTGGHIFPALAVVEELKLRIPDLDVTWLGSSHRMEAALIPSKGIKFIGLRQTEIRRSLSPGNIAYNIRSMWFLMKSIFQSVSIVKSLNPAFILTTGGFAAGAAGLAGWLTNKPLAIIEPNAYPGLTNRTLGKRAKVIFTAYEEVGKYLPRDRIRLIGVPARKDICNTNRASARNMLGIDSNIIMILAVGGSQGAREINNVLPEAVKQAVAAHPEIPIHFVHQCGKGKLSSIRIDPSFLPENMYRIMEFIDDIPLYMASADFVISRAGASTLTEIACRGLASILIPFAQSAENHQIKNARAWEKAGAAICIEKSELNPSILAEKISLLLTDNGKRKKMGESARQFGDPMAASKIADYLAEMIKGKSVS